MLNFLKTFRRNSKNGKYLKYALGEISLVVVGILIAVALNNWNDFRKDRQSEKEYLLRLTDDLETDSLNYSWTSKASLVKKYALEQLLHISKEREKVAINSDSLIQYLSQGRMLSFALPPITTATFEELKNTGNFKQIKNLTLRTALNNYYFLRGHDYVRVNSKRMEIGYGDFIDTLIPGLNAIADPLHYEQELVSWNEILEILDTPDFRKAVISEYNFSLFMYDIQIRGLNESQALMEHVRAELDQKFK